METLLMEELLNDYLKYDNKIGEFFWKKKCGQNTQVGGVAGSIVKGSKTNYRIIRFKNERVYSHVLTWYFFNGLAKNKILHIDGNGLNNKIDNLKLFIKMNKEEKAKKDCVSAMKYYYNHKEKSLIDNKNWRKKQRDENTDWYIKNKMRTRIKAFLKSKGIKIKNKTESLLGCPAINAIIYLKNMGYDPRIHDIDHIIPLCLFDINNNDHFRIMFHYSNLQPLCKIKNRKTKRSKLDDGWESSLEKTCKILNIDINMMKKYFYEKLRANLCAFYTSDLRGNENVG